ncbi:hypothetical protein DN824_12815 [Stutzerimonas nosocomialis]|nr:hypothetical protein DN824_12815 [Stutzerimonas nosocomialis]
MLPDQERLWCASAHETLNVRRRGLSASQARQRPLVRSLSNHKVPYMTDDMTHVAPPQSPAPLGRPRRTFGLAVSIPLLLAVATPFLYLHGKAYHEGYLGYFDLEPSMFPLDTAATLMTAVMAWAHAATAGITGLTALLAANLGLVLALFVLAVLLFGTFNYLVRRYRPALERSRRAQAGDAPASWWRELVRSALYLFLPGYALFALLLLVALIILLNVVPFVKVGAGQAARDLQGEFRRAPAVQVADMAGAVSEYRLIQCSTLFCALYARGTVMAVPVSAINAAVTDVGDKLASGQDRPRRE